MSRAACHAEGYSHQVKKNDPVGAGHARDITAIIAGVGANRSRAWPAPIKLNLMAVMLCLSKLPLVDLKAVKIPPMSLIVISIHPFCKLCYKTNPNKHQ
ncbi:MAG: hypothetical protein ACXWTS_05930 [Methylococcaceae bacterium]